MFFLFFLYITFETMVKVREMRKMINNGCIYVIIESILQLE